MVYYLVALGFGYGPTGLGCDFLWEMRVSGGLLLVLYNYGLQLLLGYFEGYSINFDFVKEE